MTKYQIKPIAQDTPELCWEACARMMAEWKHPEGAEMRTRLNNRISDFRGGWNKGLRGTALQGFGKMLGMLTLPSPRGANIRHALKWSPVMITTVSSTGGHVRVITFHDGVDYTVIDPVGGQVMPEARLVVGGTDTVGASEAVERPLGADGTASSGHKASVTLARAKSFDRILGEVMLYWP